MPTTPGPVGLGLLYDPAAVQDAIVVIGRATEDATAVDGFRQNSNLPGANFAVGTELGDASVGLFGAVRAAADAYVTLVNRVRGTLRYDAAFIGDFVEGLRTHDVHSAAALSALVSSASGQAQSR